MQNLAIDSSTEASGRLGRGLAIGLEVLGRSGLLVAQVLEQNVREFVAGAAAQRLQDRLVFPHGLAPALALAGEIGGIAHAADASGEVRVSRLQRLVARGLDDLLMDQLIDAEILVHVP